MSQEENTEQETVSIRCTKEDKYKVSLCQCAECLAELKEVSEVKGHMVDDDLWVGWGIIQKVLWFTCPVCHQPSVAVTPHTGEFGNYCLNELCRVKVNIQSDKLVEYINSQSKIRKV